MEVVGGGFRSSAMISSTLNVVQKKISSRGGDLSKLPIQVTYMANPTDKKSDVRSASKVVSRFSTNSKMDSQVVGVDDLVS